MVVGEEFPMIDWSLLRNSFTHAHATLNFWYAKPLPKRRLSLSCKTQASHCPNGSDAVPNLTVHARHQLAHLVLGLARRLSMHIARLELV